MKPKLRLLSCIGVLALSCFIVGHAVGQFQIDITQEAFEHDLYEAQKGKGTESVNKLTDLYLEATKDPREARGMLSTRIGDDKRGEDATQRILIFQAAQNARLIEQNDEIIRLLKEQKK